MTIQAVVDEIGGPSPTVIKVIGCGGAGTNAVNWMCECALQGVQFYAANTDAQSLNSSKASVKLPIGYKTTKGLGAGSDPKIGEKAAMEDREMVENAVRGADMVFVTAGMGGGTGTGSAPIIGQVARECGALTVGVVTTPFDFAGSHKMRVAEDGIARMREAVDTLIIIPNEHLLKLADRSINFKHAFHKVDDVLRHAVQAITDLIQTSGMMNVDFADVKTAMRDQGDALMGIGVGKGEKRAIDAATNAMNNPLLEDSSIAGAHHIIVNISSGSEAVSLPEVQEIMNKIKADADDDCVVKFGLVEDDSLTDEVQVTLIATGFLRAVKPLSISGRQQAALEAEQAEKAAKKNDNIFSVDEWSDVIGSTKSLQKPARVPGGSAYPQSTYAVPGAYASAFGKAGDEEDLDLPTVLREHRTRMPRPQEAAGGVYGEPLRKVG
jgi:cell division protein FtsZ